MSKINELQNSEGFHIGYTLWCEGCGMMHAIYTAVNPLAKNGNPVWDFNGDVESPTFKPSLLVTWGGNSDQKKHICHSFIEKGHIRYLNDCTHSLKGQTVPLTERKTI